MNPVAFFLHYVSWHYSRGLVDILRVWGNFMWLPLHFFSVGTLMKTWFIPFNRLEEQYPERGHFDPEQFAGTLLVNFIMRIVGFIVRTIFILAGLVGFLFSFVVGLVFFLLWLVAPVLVPLSFFVGFGIVFA